MTASPTRPGLWHYLSYGIGMTGNQIMRDVPTAMLLFYMTNALLIEPAYAGIAILLPKIWVIVADPLVGAMSDRTRSRWGPRKPFLFAGAIVSTVTFILLFTVPVPHSHALAATLIGVLYLLLATGYSIYSVPYLTLAAEIGDQPIHRTKALSYKQYFCLVGVMAGLSLAPWLVAWGGGDKAAYRTMAWVIGAILFTTTMATALLVPVRRASDEAALPSGRLDRQVRAAFAHRPFAIVFSAALLQLVGFGINQGGGLYFLIYVMRLPMQIMAPSIIAAVIGSAAAQSLWVRLAARRGTVRAYQVASVYAALVTALILLVPRGNATAYILFGLISGTGASGYTLLSFASLIEAIALDGPDSARKGLFAAIYTAMEKATLAFGGFIVAISLSLAGFVQGAPRDQQPPSALATILLVSVVLPTVLKLASAVILGRYDARAQAPCVAETLPT